MSHLQVNFTKRRSSIPFQFLRSSTKQIQIPLVARGTTAIYQQKLINKEKLSNPSKQRLLKLKDPSYILNAKKLTRLQNIFKALDQKYNVISPQSLFIFFWNLLVAISILFNLIQVPISFFLTQQVYQDQFTNVIAICLNYLFLLILILDMFLVRINLAFYKHGELVIDRYQIFKQYSKIQFWVDLIGIISLGIYIISGSYIFIYSKIFFYVKTYSLLKLDTQFVNYLELNKYLFAFYMFLRVIVFFIFIVVWVSTIYFAIDYAYYKQQGFYYKNNLLWLTGSSAINNMNVITSFSWPYWLLYAIYWAMQTATTDGYGNMTPKNPVQTFYCNCIIIFMTLMFAFFINSVWGIINQLDQSAAYYSNWKSLKDLMKQNQFSQKTKKKVSVYFHDVWKNQDNDNSVKQITNSLSETLKNQILVSSNRYMFEGIQIFKKLQTLDPINFQNLIVSLASHIYEIRLAQKEILYDAEDQNTNLYCLLRGKVKLVFKTNYYNEIQRSIQVKAKFGNQQFFLENKKYCKAIAQCYSKVSVLQKSLFIQKLKNFPTLHKIFIILANRAKFYNQLELLGQKCWFCSQTHDTKKCPTKTDWRKKHSKREVHLYKVNVLQPMKKQDQRKQYYRRWLKSQKLIGKSYQKAINIDKVDENDRQNLMIKGFIEKNRKTKTCIQ